MSQPALARCNPLDRAHPTTPSSSVAQYPATTVPKQGLPRPWHAVAQVKVAGSRTNGEREKREVDRFWLPLESQREKLQKKMSPARVGKRPRSAPPPLEDWFAKNNQPQQGRLPSTQRQVAHVEAPMEKAQGKKRLMSPSACVNFHPFTETLRKWEEGVPVDCGEDWTREMIDAAISQGPHKSALTPEAMALVEEDVAYQVGAGYAQIVEWDWLKNHLPPQLKVSPLAVVPQQNQRGRMILDLSFPVLKQPKAGKGRKRRRTPDDIIKESVNDLTVRMAPEGPFLGGETPARRTNSPSRPSFLYPSQ